MSALIHGPLTPAKNNVIFICQDYTNINARLGDLIYLDPPYANTKGMYFGGIDLDKFYYNMKIYLVLSLFHF